MSIRATPLALLATILLSGAASAPAAAAPGVTGVYTYAGKGTVNTYWIETPGGGLVVIDVQRDLAHARAALAAVKAVGKPVRAILVTHGHPDHYAGVGVFKAAFPEAVVWASATTDRTIRTDSYGFNALMRKAAGENFPARPTPPDRVLTDDQTLEVDGLTIISREMGKAEANSATVYYMPASGELYVGDLVLNHLHALFGDAASSEWLAALDRLELIFPEARIIHPGHGSSGPKAQLLADERSYIQTAREIAADVRVRQGATAAAEVEAARRVKARFPYENPSGLPDIVAVSMHGLFAEMAKPKLEPAP